MATKTKKGEFYLFAVNLIEKLIESLKKFFSQNLLDFLTRWGIRIGHYGLLLAALIGFLFSFVVAIRSNSFRAFLLGIIWVLVIFVIQFIAKRFSNAGATLIENNPSQLSSPSFLDCVAFLSMIGGLIILIYSIINAIQLKSLEVFLSGLAIFFLLEVITLVTFNPKSITISLTKSSSAGQEAIGIVTYFLKLFLRLVPIIFGIGVAVGTVILFIHFIGGFGERLAFFWQRANTGDAGYILFAGLLPFLSYLIFVFYYLLIDIIKAILAVPQKLDNLKK